MKPRDTSPPTPDAPPSRDPETTLDLLKALENAAIVLKSRHHRYRNPSLSLATTPTRKVPRSPVARLGRPSSADWWWHARCIQFVMPFKSQAQRRKFAQLLMEGKISNETFEEWNRTTGSARLPERVKHPLKKTPKRRKTRQTRKHNTNRRGA